MKQTDKQVNPVGWWGCVLMCLAEIARREAEKLYGAPYSDEEVGEHIRKAYANLAGTWMMSTKCYVHSNEAVLQELLTLFGVDADIELWDGDQPGDYTRECWSTKWGYHYILTDYNPDPSVPVLELVGKRQYNVTVKGEI